MEEGERVDLTTFEKNKKNQVNHKGKISAQPMMMKKSKCFFCKKKGHTKKDCLRRSRSTMVIYTTVVECFKILFVSLSIYLSDAILLRKGIG